MELIFQSIEIENFKSIGHKITIDYNDFKGLNFVTGINNDIPDTNNGSGKSAIIVDSLLFAIYGTCLKNIPNKHIINRATKESTNVKLKLKSNGNNYIITSSIKNEKSTIGVTLFKNNIDITKAMSKDTRKYIQDEVIGCSKELFTASVVLCNTSQKDFLSMSKHKKREYIEEIFELLVFSDMLKLIRKDFNNIDKDICISQKEQKLYKENVDQFTEKNKKFIKNQELNIKHLQDEINKMKDIVFHTLLSEEQKEKYKFIDKYNALEKKLGSITHMKYDALSTHKSLENDRTFLNKSVGKHKQIMKIICDDCKDIIDNTYKISETEDKINNVEKDLELSNNLIETLTGQVEKLELAISKLKQIKKEYDNVTREINNNKLEEKYHVKTMETKILSIKKEKGKENPFDTLLNENKIKLKRIKNLLDEQYEQRVYLEILKHIVGEDGAKQFILRDLIDVINNLICSYLQRMNSNYTIIFDESFDCSFITTTGECSFNNFSEGESRRINIAILFAFRALLFSNNNITSNLMIIDELIDAGLCESGVSSTLDIIKKETIEKNLTTFVISHRPEVACEDGFNKIIQIEKNNHISEMNIK